MTQVRINLIRSAFDHFKIDALLVESPQNCRWLSHFTGSACTLLISRDKALLGTDFRYWEQAAQQASDFELIKMSRTDPDMPTIGDMFEMSGGTRIGIEADKVTLVDFVKYHKAVEAKGLQGVEFVELNAPLDPFRAQKSADEIEEIRKAARITDQAMGAAHEIIQAGLTERQIAWEFEKRMREAGADGVAFEIIVASGPNAAMAHHHPGDRVVHAGDVVLVDMGAMLNGYHSDLTRTFLLCKKDAPKDDKFDYVYNLVHTAQKRALQEMRAGMTGKAIDELAREVIDDAGHAKNFGHSLGHGVGLQIHEAPSLSARNKTEIRPDSIVTVEPGVYLSGWGGVRIEDLVVVHENRIEIISQCPKDPYIFIE